MNTQELFLAWIKLLRASPREIKTLIIRGPYQYKHYQIPKRTGGMRDIYHPTPNLKALQRWVASNLLCNLPIHQSVYSYRRGVGIRQHADAHVHSNFLLRLDFSDFFPSIDSEWLQDFLADQVRRGILGCDSEAVPILIRILCRYEKRDGSLALSIGAPSSPLLSNAILFDADNLASLRCAELGCLYTRYADDIYVSSREKCKLNEAEMAVRQIFAENTPRLHFNERKTVNLSKKARRVVTGVTLTPDRKLSVGRELKRSIKTRVYLSITDNLPVDELMQLCGLIAYIRDVEPAFYDSLCKKFGDGPIEKLYRSVDIVDSIE